jgi:hypothetical protein
MLVIERIWGMPIVFTEEGLERMRGRMKPMEIEVEQVLYIDGQEVSTRRERVASTNVRFRQDLWACAENNLKDFRQKVNAYEEPPF